MRDPFANLLAILAAAMYVVLGVMPQGTALCLGGGHEWGEVIATACSHDGHTHGPALEAIHHHDDCAGCDHHAADAHGPCTDIPIDTDEGRTASASNVKFADGHAADPGVATALGAFAALLPAPTKASVGAKPRSAAMRPVTAALRAVIQRR